MVVSAVLLALTSLAPSLDLYRAQKFEAAEKSFRRSLERNPQDAQTRLYLARTLIQLNRTAEALAEIERVLSKAPDPEIRFQAGRILRGMAERRFAQLQAQAPDSPATLELAGERMEWMGQLDEALKQYSEAAKRAPTRPGVHYKAGNVLWRKRDIPAARAALRKELLLNPHHGMANLRSGEILLNSHQPEQALPYLERAVAAMPQSADARREIGKALRRTGNLERARSEWETVARMRPDDDQVFYLLGSLYRETGEAELAKRALQQHRSILARRRQAQAEP